MENIEEIAQWTQITAFLLQRQKMKHQKVKEIKQVNPSLFSK